MMIYNKLGILYKHKGILMKKTAIHIQHCNNFLDVIILVEGQGWGIRIYCREASLSYLSPTIIYDGILLNQDQ